MVLPMSKLPLTAPRLPISRGLANSSRYAQRAKLSLAMAKHRLFNALLPDIPRNRSLGLLRFVNNYGLIAKSTRNKRPFSLAGLFARRGPRQLRPNKVRFSRVIDFKKFFIRSRLTYYRQFYATYFTDKVRRRDIHRVMSPLSRKTLISANLYFSLNISHVLSRVFPLLDRYTIKRLGQAGLVLVNHSPASSMRGSLLVGDFVRLRPSKSFVRAYALRLNQQSNLVRLAWRSLRRQANRRRRPGYAFIRTLLKSPQVPVNFYKPLPG